MEIQCGGDYLSGWCCGLGTAPSISCLRRRVKSPPLTGNVPFGPFSTFGTGLARMAFDSNEQWGLVVIGGKVN